MNPDRVSVGSYANNAPRPADPPPKPDKPLRSGWLGGFSARELDDDGGLIGQLRKLTEQEINLWIDQARAIGEL